MLQCPSCRLWLCVDFRLALWAATLTLLLNSLERELPPWEWLDLVLESEQCSVALSLDMPGKSSNASSVALPLFFISMKETLRQKSSVSKSLLFNFWKDSVNISRVVPALTPCSHCHLALDPSWRTFRSMWLSAHWNDLAVALWLLCIFILFLSLQEPLSEAAAVLIRHPGLCSVWSYGSFLSDGCIPHSVCHVNSSALLWRDVSQC